MIHNFQPCKTLILTLYNLRIWDFVNYHFLVQMHLMKLQTLFSFIAQDLILLHLK